MRNEPNTLLAFVITAVITSYVCAQAYMNYTSHRKNTNLMTTFEAYEVTFLKFCPQMGAKLVCDMELLIALGDEVNITIIKNIL